MKSSLPGSKRRLALAVVMVGAVGLASAILGLRAWRGDREACRPFEGRIAGLEYAPVGTPCRRRELPPRPDGGPVFRGGEPRQTLADDAVLDLLSASRDRERLGEAVERLRRTVARDPDNALLWNDLATGYLARAEAGEPPDFARALSSVQRAAGIAPGLPEVRFNLALALEKNLLFSDAAEAWRAYLELDDDSRWADEAGAHLRRVEEPSRLVLWQRLRPDLEAAASSGDLPAVRRIVEDFPYYARDFAENELLPRWAEALEGGRSGEAERTLRVARPIATTLVSVSGEHLLADSLAALDRLVRRGDTEALLGLARAYREGAQGRSLCHSNEAARGEDLVLRAREGFQRAGSPAADRAMADLALCAYQRSKLLLADARLAELSRLPGLERYPGLRGRMHWLAGLSAMRQAEPARAQEEYETALRIFERTRSGPELGSVLYLLGENQLYLGETGRAWTFLRRGLESAVAEGEVRSRYRTFDGMADFTARAGLPDVALRFRTEVVRMARAEPDPTGLSHAYLRRAETRFQLGGGGEAANDLRLSRAAWAGTQDADDRRREEANLLLAEGRIRGASQPEAALRLLSRAVSIYETSGYRWPIVDAYLLRAKAGLAVGDLAGAERDLRAGLGEFERQRGKVKDEGLRLTYFEQARELFDHLIGLKAQRPDGGEEAFNIAERQRARVLLDRLAPERRAQPLTLGEVRRRLPAGVVLVVYTLLSDRLLIWTVRRDADPRLITAEIAAKDLAGRVDGLLGALAGRARDEEVAERLTSLHDLLLERVLPALRPGDRLVFIPDGVLHRVPFAALLDPDTGRYLVEDHALGIAPSASLAVEEAERPGAGGESLDVLVVADPDFDRQEFPDLSPLKEAGQEAGFLKELFAGRGLFLPREAASPGRFLEEAGRHAVVHMATHALVNPDHPHLSRLVLAPDGPGDPGTLTAAEIQGLDLSRTRLVFLGACRSGEGKLASEGVLSLARAFQAAGAPEVVASLWNLEDTDAAALSETFYRSFLRHGDSVAALRETHLEALDRTGRRASQLARWAGLQVATRVGIAGNSP